MSGVIKASDCKCCQCGKPAVCFWPACDPDIPQYPYCRECVDEAKLILNLRLFDQEKAVEEMEKARERRLKTLAKKGKQ